MQNEGVTVACAVVTSGESIPVRVINPINQPVTLYKGTRIAELTEIEEVGNSSTRVASVQQGTVSLELEEALSVLAEQASIQQCHTMFMKEFWVDIWERINHWASRKSDFIGPVIIMSNDGVPLV